MVLDEVPTVLFSKSGSTESSYLANSYNILLMPPIDPKMTFDEL